MTLPVDGGPAFGSVDARPGKLGLAEAQAKRRPGVRADARRVRGAHAEVRAGPDWFVVAFILNFSI